MQQYTAFQRTTWEEEEQNLPFSYEFHSWIKGKIEMESISLSHQRFLYPFYSPSPSLFCPLALSFHRGDGAVPPRADSQNYNLSVC